MNADPIVLEPGSPQWQGEMTASKVAAVLGLSPWDSPFSLWYKMAGYVEPEPQTDQQSRGHYLEPAVVAWLRDQYQLTIAPGGCWRHKRRRWQVSTPDRLAVGPPWEEDGLFYSGTALAIVEAKTAADWEAWGPDGSDEIPPYYRAQVVWQCDTLGLDTAYVGVLLPRLEFRGYVIHPARGEAKYIRDACRTFLDSLQAGVPPDIVNSPANGETYRVLKALNPLVDKEAGPVQVTEEEARAYCHAVERYKSSKDVHDYERNLMAQRMGTAAKAVVVVGDAVRTVAYRQGGAVGVDPYVKAPPVARLPYRLEEGE